MTPATTASDQFLEDVLARVELGEDARRHLAELPRFEQGAALVESLIEAGLLTDATAVLVELLGEVDSLRWACDCLRSVPDCHGDEDSMLALAAAEAWVDAPDEEHRRRAQAAREQHDFSRSGAATAWAATAASWSGAPGYEALDASAVAPPDAAGAVRGAILLAATLDANTAAEVLTGFLERGLELVRPDVSEEGGRSDVPRRPRR